MKKLFIILGVLGTAFSAIFVRFSDADPTALAFYRMAFAAILLLPVLIIKYRKEWKELKWKQFVLCMISGAFFGMHLSCYFESLHYTSIASSVVLVDTEVFFVAIGGLIIWKEKLSLHGWIGIMVAFLGSLVIAMGDMGTGSNQLKGDLIALTGAFCMSVYTLIGKKCRKSMSTTLYTGIVYFFAALALLVKMLLTHIPVTGYAGYNYLVALGLTIFCTFLGHTIFNWGLKYEKVTFISTAKLLEPIFASVLGIILFQEIPGMSTVIGGFVVIAGIVYYIQMGKKKEEAAEG